MDNVVLSLPPPPHLFLIFNILNKLNTIIVIIVIIVIIIIRCSWLELELCWAEYILDEILWGIYCLPVSNGQCRMNCLDIVDLVYMFRVRKLSNKKDEKGTIKHYPP